MLELEHERDGEQHPDQAGKEVEPGDEIDDLLPASREELDGVPAIAVGLERHAAMPSWSYAY